MSLQLLRQAQAQGFGFILSDWWNSVTGGAAGSSGTAGASGSSGATGAAGGDNPWGGASAGVSGDNYDPFGGASAGVSGDNYDPFGGASAGVGGDSSPASSYSNWNFFSALTGTTPPPGAPKPPVSNTVLYLGLGLVGVVVLIAVMKK